MSTNMILIPDNNNDETAKMMACSAAPPSVGNSQLLKSEEEDSSAHPPRRVSFRIDEVDIAQEIANSVGGFDDDYDSDDEEENDGSLILPSAASGPLNCAADVEEEVCTRGLELKRAPQRQKRKFTIIKSIVRNQRQANTKTLGKLATVCNLWAADAARIQAQWDYQDVYHHSHQRTIRELPDMDRYPMPFKKKNAKRPAQQGSSAASAGDHQRTSSSCKRIKTC